MPSGKRLGTGWPIRTENLFGNIHLTQIATGKLLLSLHPRFSGAEQEVIYPTPMEAEGSTPITLPCDNDEAQ